MQSASIPQTLIDVRPVVRNMRPDGYVLQTGGSATRKVIEMEGNQARPLFRVTGVPRHTHNASALLQVEAKHINPTASETSTISFAGEFSEEKTEIAPGDYVDQAALTPEEVDARFKRSIEWGIGRIELQPENSRNKISEPTRAISEIRTLVCPREIRESSTFVETKYTMTDRAGNGLQQAFPEIVQVPVLPVNNGHLESVFGGRVTNADQDLRLEIWPDLKANSPLFDKGGVNNNDWENFSQDWVNLLDDQQPPEPIPYPVALARIGSGKPVQVRTAYGAWVDWDGRVPYRYVEDRDVYELERPIQIRFQSKVYFTTNGHLAREQADDDKTVLKNWFDPTKQADGTTALAAGSELGGLVFEISEVPKAVRKPDGFYYINDGGLGHIMEAADPHRRRYGFPRVVVKGKFLSSETKVEVDGGPEWTSEFRRKIRNAADDADIVQDPVYGANFENAVCGWFAPMVRWEVGSKVALSGPLIRPINFDLAGGHVLFAETAELLSWSSAFQAVRDRTFEHSKAITITDGTVLADLLDIRPNAASLHEVKTDLPEADAEDLADTKAVVNATTSHAVPFRAGLYPFSQDFRFKHFAGERGKFDIAMAQKDANYDGAECANMYVPEPGVPDPDDVPGRRNREIHRTGIIAVDWEVEADFATPGSDSDKMLKHIGFLGTSRESVYANIRTIPVPSLYTVDGVERGRTKLIEDRRYGTGQVVAVCPWASEFLMQDPAGGADKHVICPCAYVGLPTLDVHDLDDGAAQFNAGDDNPKTFASLAIAIDQYPFYRDAFERGVLRYRGGYCYIEKDDRKDGGGDYEFGAPPEPTVGNVFGFGSTDYDKGGVEIVAAGANHRVTMSVQVMASGGTRGVLRVKGLAFHPRTRTRTLLFYYGAAKTLYISDPGKRVTSLDVIKAVGDGSTRVEQKCWTTDIPVRSFDTIVGAAAVDIDSTQADSHLYMAVVAPRSQGLFTVHGALDELITASRGTGVINAPSYVITQSIAAPVLNSDFRGECVEPLNQMTAFLPPELRDFNLILRDMDWRHMGATLQTNVKRLIFSEFNGGNQQVAAVPSLLSVPEFRIYTAVVQAGDTAFDIELFTPMGPPSFWAIYARSDESPNYGTQPLIVNLSMSCLTTGKKSDSIDDTGLAELYFMTQRNVHRKALYEHNAFNERQVVLLRSEDVGTMGLNPALYQREKRTRYRVKGAIRVLDASSTVNVVLVYNNRGLQIQGKEISVHYL